MAHQWYVQHGGKQHGPISSAQLKKLAAEGKISPSTNVRLGADAKWVPAGRVQGLFAAQPSAAAVAPPVEPLRAVPTPPPPPMASPLARVPIGSVTSAAKSAPQGEPAIAPKIVGAVGLIFGILALATFWLPLLGGPIGWIGIGVGGMGLLLGILGLVLAAIHQGHGLYLNVAAASSAVVGLVLTVVLGITFGMFSQPTNRPVAMTLPPVVEPIAQPPAPPVAAQPEPEPPPKLVWTDAGQPLEQPPIKATIVGVGVEKVRLESTDLTKITAAKSQPMLRIRVAIENTSADKIVRVPGWTGMGAGALGGQLGGLLGEQAKELQSATATAQLLDNAGNSYPQTPAFQLFGAQSLLGEDSSLRPGNSTEKVLGVPAAARVRGIPAA